MYLMPYEFINCLIYLFRSVICISAASLVQTSPTSVYKACLSTVLVYSVTALHADVSPCHDLNPRKHYRVFSRFHLCGGRWARSRDAARRHLLSEHLKMATTGTLHLRRISASLAVFLGLLGLFDSGTCDEQVPLLLWTSEGWEMCPCRRGGGSADTRLWRSYPLLANG